MSYPAWRNQRWLRATIIVFTVVATVALATHPELRLLIPFVDSLGLDLVVLLFASQFLEFARAVAAEMYQRVLLPTVSLAYPLSIFMLGIIGPQVDGFLSTRRGAGLASLGLA